MFFPAAVKLFQQEVTKNVGISGAGFRLELAKNALCHHFGFFTLGKARAFFKHPVEVEDITQTRQSCCAGFVLTVRRDGSRLLTRATGQEELEVFPASETEYFLKVVDARITFVKGGDGKVTGLVLRQGGRERPAKRVR